MADQAVPLSSIVPAGDAGGGLSALGHALIQGDPTTSEAVRQELYRRGLTKLKLPYQIGFPSLLQDAQQRQAHAIQGLFRQ